MQPTTTDTALVERVQRGDHHAFAELVRRHDRGLRTLATRLLRSPERVDDVLQDVYLEAFRRIGTFRRDATVAPGCTASPTTPASTTCGAERPP